MHEEPNIEKLLKKAGILSDTIDHRISRQFQNMAYLFPVATFMLPAFCGVRTDENMGVLDYSLEKIPHLVAVGDMVGGVSGVGIACELSFSKSILTAWKAVKAITHEN